MSYTIGFSNLAESIPSCAYRRQTLEAAALQYPDLHLVLRDNDLNDEKALANVEEFARLPVDLAIIFHINERLGSVLSQPLMKKSIPIIAVDVPILFTTYFGANNQRAGWLAGESLGQWISANWNGEIDRVLATAESRVTSIVRQRLDYALKALAEHASYDANRVLFMECGSNRTTAAQRAYEVLQGWPDSRRIAVIGINDDSALGVLDAARVLGREADVAISGQGADAAVREEMRRPNSPFIASTDFRMSDYGPRLIDLAVRILSGERVPSQNFIEHICVTQWSLAEE